MHHDTLDGFIQHKTYKSKKNHLLPLKIIAQFFLIFISPLNITKHFENKIDFRCICSFEVI